MRYIFFFFFFVLNIISPTNGESLSEINLTQNGVDL